MTQPKRLFLYEEIMLLALRDQKGTLATNYSEYAVAGAVLAELLLDRRIAVDGTSKGLVDVLNATPTGDPIIDECLEKVTASGKRASLQSWLSRLAGIKKLRHKVALQLCNRGVLRADEDTVLFIFTRKVYPEINPVPEKKIIERVRTAIFTDTDQVDPRTVALISLANGADLLGGMFGRKEVRTRKKRIEKIVNGEMTGKATREVIAACESAAMVATMAATLAATCN